jgi:guanine deaminase
MGMIIKGIIITSSSNKTINVYNPGYLAISDQGIIEEISTTNLRQAYPNHHFEDHSQHLILPGFIDLHNHLPQYAFAGLGKGPLLDWLNKYTFPREEIFQNTEYAQKAAKQFFTDLIKAGTTTTVSYSSIHEEATDIIFSEADKIGIRAIIGKVMMDQNAPINLQEKTNESLASTERLIKKWHQKNNRLFYAITPRFAITCTQRLMQEAGHLQKKYDTYLQTHVAENREEVATIKKLFPSCRSYLDVYDKAGLLGPKTMLAHGIYLDEEDLKIIQKTQTKIIHCPTSNHFMSSGIMPMCNYINRKIIIGIGTDVAGGYSLSMLHEMRSALEMSKIFSVFNSKKSPPLTIDEAFYYATLGGAQVLGIESTTGSLEVGKSADIIILDPQIADQWIWENNYQEPLELFTKCIYATRGNAVIKTFMQGVPIAIN